MTDIQSSKVMAISEMPLSNMSHILGKMEPHRFLNVCKGVVTCYDLDCVGPLLSVSTLSWMDLLNSMFP
uniref:Uncharacterized protein n=1 Tax=Timema poppense TaxID=170557 RepID=A0A7R9DDT4_TIMPO|nr:unnamed protein product [Timema poppensis]